MHRHFKNRIILGELYVAFIRIGSNCAFCTVYFRDADFEQGQTRTAHTLYILELKHSQMQRLHIRGFECK